ncbi:MAG: nicotinamide mononucleotide transporter [Erysipelotrichaceae bacterium]|nr:nicotinamide mononucleotide transporter [Erysipelotrichaceae bacterium]
MSFNRYLEPDRKIRILESVSLCILIPLFLFLFISSMIRINAPVGELVFLGNIEMYRDRELEDYDENNTVCDVTYKNGDDSLIITYTYEEYEGLEDDSLTAYGYETENGTRLFFDHEGPTAEEIKATYRQVKTDEMMPKLNISIALAILALSVGVMLGYGAFFSTYEKCWFLSIMVLATIAAILFPEESANGVNGVVIMFLYLLDTFLNILCELLISKQSRYNFLVSVLVEITEIVICIVLMYRFATMVTTLFFWLPIDILSFINWSKHKDQQEDELTAVRRLKGYQEVLIIIAIAVWTIVVGYFISGLDIKTDFINNKSIETLVAYLDACASAVGVANGLFIFFRLREQWIAWYVNALLESVINIISGQYVLLILKLGYFTNTTYGYIKWSRYIASRGEEKGSLF